MRDRRGEAIRLGNAYVDLGELLPDGDRPGAIQCYEAALAVAQQIGDQHMEGTILTNLGQAYRDKGDVSRARECWTQALAILEAIEDPNAEEVRCWLAEQEDRKATP
jgi:tetratricopeptide (TPR) repeat protein